MEDYLNIVDLIENNPITKLSTTRSSPANQNTKGFHAIGTAVVCIQLLLFFKLPSHQ